MEVMMKYTCKRDTESLGLMDLGKILSEFQTNDAPKLQKYWDYFKGRQAILLKQSTDTGKPNNCIVTNYCQDIVNNYNGYITGKQIAYNGENIDDILDILRYNDVQNEDTQLLKNALIFGTAYEINYIDEEAKQRFKVLDSRQVIPVYDDTLTSNLKFVIRFWEEDLVSNMSTSYAVEVYSDYDIKRYKSGPGFMTFEFVDAMPHHYGQVPITVFDLTEDREPIFKQIMGLQDAYNTILSDEVNDFESFADAYLVLKGMNALEDDLIDMKSKRCLIMDNDADASYLTKNLSDTQVENILKNLNDQIYKKSGCPDFADEKFMTQSGEALKWKMVGFENRAAVIESYMRKALQKRFELISAILNLYEATWRDVDIIFTRNLPTMIADVASMVNALKGVVSTETLLANIPYVKDVKKELELLGQEVVEDEPNEQ